MEMLIAQASTGRDAVELGGASLLYFAVFIIIVSVIFGKKK